jgi:hypothetical protein
MPNHITNRLYVTANSAEELTDFLKSIGTKESAIDFNKIVPMPQDLKGTEESSTTDDSICYYLIQTNQEELLNKIRRFNYNDNRFDGKSEEELAELYKKGKKYVDNYKNYGSATWYRWSLNNWGTKWNAYDVSLWVNETEDGAIITFDTAWSGVPDLIEKLAKKFPNIYFEYKFADEDFAQNTGYGDTDEEGNLYMNYPDGDSDEAVELFIECKGYNKDDFYKDNEGKWHCKEWEDDYEDEE